MPFESKSQVRACFAKKKNHENGSWNCEEWAHSTSDIKKLPEHVKKEAELDDATAFKAGFLLKALEDGLTPEEITKRAEQAIETLTQKSAFGWGDAGKAVADFGAAGAIGLPLLAGSAAGYGLGKIRNNAEVDDTENMKLENRIAQYRRLVEDARRQAKLKQMQAEHPGEIVPIG